MKVGDTNSNVDPIKDYSSYCSDGYSEDDLGDDTGDDKEDEGDGSLRMAESSSVDIVIGGEDCCYEEMVLMGGVNEWSLERIKFLSFKRDWEVKVLLLELISGEC